MTPQLKFRLQEEEAEILRIVETEHVNYETAKRRLAAREMKVGPKAEPRPAHWKDDREDD